MARLYDPSVMELAFRKFVSQLAFLQFCLGYSIGFVGYLPRGPLSDCVCEEHPLFRGSSNFGYRARAKWVASTADQRIHFGCCLDALAAGYRRVRRALQSDCQMNHFLESIFLANDRQGPSFSNFAISPDQLRSIFDSDFRASHLGSSGDPTGFDVGSDFGWIAEAGQD